MNYFNQVFNDENTAFDMASLGLVDRFQSSWRRRISKSRASIRRARRRRKAATTSPAISPTTLSWVIGKHQIKLGGEFRKAQLDEFYHRHALGIFTFDGSQGPDAAQSQRHAGMPAILASTLLPTSFQAVSPTLRSRWAIRIARSSSTPGISSPRMPGKPQQS